MKRKFTHAVLTLLLALGLSSVAAYADTVSFTLTNGNLFVSPGGSVTYDATVSAPLTNSAPVFLNGDSFNVDGPLSIDDTDFYNDFPLSLNAGDSFTGDLFTVIVPPDTLMGPYGGSFTLLGGVDDGADDILGTVNFVTTVTPEPSSFLLLGTALLGAAGVLRRRFV